MIIEFLKAHAPLESVTVHLFLLGVLAVWFWIRPSSRAPLRALVFVIGGYALLSTRLGADTLIYGLGHGFAPIRDRAEARGADTVVVLGSGIHTFKVGENILGVLTQGSALRALEGARVFKVIDAQLLVASGGIPYPEYTLKPESEFIRAAAVSAGVPAERVFEESTSRNTRDEARILAPMLRARNGGRFVLVTSPTHMRRSLAVFRKEGLDPIPSVAPIRSEHMRPPPLFKPSDESRILSDGALYDYAATVYYWWNNWTR